MPTIIDVAKAAGVSTATVSRVINQSSGVVPDTVVRVQQAMKQLGYQIKGNRRLSVNQGDDTLGLILSSFNSPFFSLLTQGVDKIARKLDRKLMVASGQYDPECEEEALNFMINKSCRHIVFHSKAMSENALIKYARQLPGLVIINRHIKEIEQQCVWLENTKGTYQATRYLLEQGHRRIGFLGLELDIDDQTERFAGYRQALQEAGIRLNSDWVEEVPTGEQGGALGATNFLNKGLPVTALVAYNDYFAAAAMQVFKEHGVKVPEDLSVIGFDDVLPQCYFNPRLTTIRSPIESMAMNAALISVEGKKSPVARRFQPLLVKRDSVCRANTGT